MKGGVLWVEYGGGSSGGKRVYFREGKRFVEGFIYCAAVVVFVTQERGGGCCVHKSRVKVLHLIYYPIHVHSLFSELKIYKKRAGELYP